MDAPGKEPGLAAGARGQGSGVRKLIAGLWLLASALACCGCETIRTTGEVRTDGTIWFDRTATSVLQKRSTDGVRARKTGDDLDINVGRIDRDQTDVLKTIEELARTARGN